MKKQMIIMLVVVALVFALIFGWKVLGQKAFKKQMAKMQNPAMTVSTMVVGYSQWQPTLQAVGSLRARMGVNVTTELAGMVQSIHFKPGATVEKGELLVQLNAGTELGLLHSLQAQLELAKITYRRDKAQYAVHAVSKQVLDNDEWTVKNLQAQVEEQAATAEKKTLRAPFAGQLGINQINPGQYLNVGDPVTTLQALSPLYVDFYLPQQTLSQLNLGQKASVLSDAFPKKTFLGDITTIQPQVDNNNRNVLVEATLPNLEKQLKPGMFVQVSVNVGEKIRYLTLPQSAISYNPYGDIVYVVNKTQDNKNSLTKIWTVKEVFVTLGDTRGDQVAVLSGIQEGDQVVTSGQLKLKNGSPIVINNQIQPSNQAKPKVPER